VGQAMNVRIVVLIVIDLILAAGLGVLLLWGDGRQGVAMIACVALILYVSYSIYAQMRKARAPK
jgi:hypothetical protein